MSSLASRLAQASCEYETALVMRDVEATAKDFPERSVPFCKHLIPLFASPNSSIRKSAFNAALSIINSKPLAAEQLLPAYRCALFSSDQDVSHHALTFLPHFVSVSLDQAQSLIQCALKASQRMPQPDANTYVSQAMDVVKRIPNLPK